MQTNAWLWEIVTLYNLIYRYNLKGEIVFIGCEPIWYFKIKYNGKNFICKYRSIYYSQTRGFFMIVSNANAVKMIVLHL